VPFKSASAAMNPIVKEKMVKPSSNPRAPDWFVTKRQIKLLIAALPDDKPPLKLDLVTSSYAWLKSAAKNLAVFYVNAGDSDAAPDLHRTWHRAKLSRESSGDLAQWRPRPIGNRCRRRSDVNKSGYALVRCQAKRIEHTAIVSVPPGDPVGPISEGVRGEDKVHGSGSGGVRA